MIQIHFQARMQKSRNLIQIFMKFCVRVCIGISLRNNVYILAVSWNVHKNKNILIFYQLFRKWMLFI